MVPHPDTSAKIFSQCLAYSATSVARANSPSGTSRSRIKFDRVPLDEASMLVAGLGPRFRKLHEHGFGDFAGEMIAQDKASIATDEADIFYPCLVNFFPSLQQGRGDALRCREIDSRALLLRDRRGDHPSRSRSQSRVGHARGSAHPDR